MTKKKKPTAKNLRQGQTVYAVMFHHLPSGQYTAYISAYMLHSQKTDLPEAGVMIKKMPVHFAKHSIIDYGNRNLFYSRKRAVSVLRLLKPFVPHG